MIKSHKDWLEYDDLRLQLSTKFGRKKETQKNKQQCLLVREVIQRYLITSRHAQQDAADPVKERAYDDACSELRELGRRYL